MTRIQAQDIVSKFILENVLESSRSLEEMYVINPIIAKIYETYMESSSLRTPRWFYEEAENALIIANSKLGKALG